MNKKLITILILITSLLLGYIVIKNKTFNIKKDSKNNISTTKLHLNTSIELKDFKIDEVYKDSKYGDILLKSYSH